jgi:VanZ family protein
MKRFFQGALLAWIFVVVFLHLAPTSDRWERPVSQFARDISLSKEDGQAVAHVILMAGCAFLLMNSLVIMPKRRAFMVSFVACILLSGLLELMQAVVPSAFRRQCDIADMLPAITGALIGCCAGLGVPASRN